MTSVFKNSFNVTRQVSIQYLLVEQRLLSVASIHHVQKTAFQREKLLESIGFKRATAHFRLQDSETTRKRDQEKKLKLNILLGPEVSLKTPSSTKLVSRHLGICDFTVKPGTAQAVATELIDSLKRSGPWPTTTTVHTQLIGTIEMKKDEFEFVLFMMPRVSVEPTITITSRNLCQLKLE